MIGGRGQGGREMRWRGGVKGDGCTKGEWTVSGYKMRLSHWTIGRLLEQSRIVQSSPQTAAP